MRLFALFAPLALLACASPTGATFVPPVAIVENARIPFASSTGIRSWRVLPDESLLIEGRQGKSYRATFFGSCPDIRTAQTVGFITDATGALDRYGSVVVRVAGGGARRCRLSTLDEVAPSADAAPEPETAPPVG